MFFFYSFLFFSWMVGVIFSNVLPFGTSLPATSARAPGRLCLSPETLSFETRLACLPKSNPRASRVGGGEATFGAGPPPQIAWPLCKVPRSPQNLLRKSIRSSHLWPGSPAEQGRAEIHRGTLKAGCCGFGMARQSPVA